MTYKNEKNNSKPHYNGNATPMRGRDYARMAPNGGADATKHCSSCTCGAQHGGLESEIYKALGGMANTYGQPPIQININYFLTPDMIGAYGQESNYGAGQGAKILPYNGKKNNDSYGKERNYDRKAA